MTREELFQSLDSLGIAEKLKAGFVTGIKKPIRSDDFFPTRLPAELHEGFLREEKK